MSPPILDLEVAVFRNFSVGGGSMSTQQAFARLRCAIVPVSRLDSPQDYAYESTHVVWVPHWIALRKEDELRYGRRPPDPFGNIVQFVYVLNGHTRITQSVQLHAYYAREKD